jgi:GNAT superfamily N-acetyltransferase
MGKVIRRRSPGARPHGPGRAAGLTEPTGRRARPADPRFGRAPGQVRNNAVMLAIRRLAGHDSWVLTDSGTVAGFAVAAHRPPGGAEILQIAVDLARRGQRLGTVLLDWVLGVLAAVGVSVVEAKTLDASAGFRRENDVWLIAEYLMSGWLGEDDLTGIMGGNFMRVSEQAVPG